MRSDKEIKELIESAFSAAEMRYDARNFGL
jgi:hypothetical protein